MLAALPGWLQQFLSQFPALARTSIFNDVWFQNLILAITAVIGIWTFGSSSRHERRRATVDLVRDQQKDKALKKARQALRPLELDASGKIDFDSILASEKDSYETRAILTVLNSYEFMASGVRTGAFDEKTYKRMYYNSVKLQWLNYREFVVKYREKYKRDHPGKAGQEADTFYQDFERLATRWLRRPLKQPWRWHASPPTDAGSLPPQAPARPQIPPPVQPQSPSQSKRPSPQPRSPSQPPGSPPDRSSI